MAPSDPRQTKFVLDEIAYPARLVQHRRRPAVPPRAGAPSGHRPADRTRRPGAALPDGAHRAGRQPRPRDRDPRAGPRRLRAVPAEPALPGASAGEGARYPGPHLLQVRGRQPVGQPQAEHGARPGLLQQGGRRDPPGDRDRRRAVGQRAGLRRRRLRPRGQGLHGPRELRPEAVPADPDGDVRRRRSCASPSPDTSYGRKVLAENPDHTGSLGIAISEAIEDTVTHPGTKYSLGSVFDFVLLHQTVIGQEAIEQMEMAGEEPDVIIGCAGGGSNFAGLTFPWLGRTFRGGKKYRVIAVEPEAAPSLTRGVYAYDFGDTAQMTPLVKMHTLGHDFIPEPIHAGGLRYHGMAPLVSLLKDHGDIEARASTSARASRRASSSPGPRGSCRRPSRPTPSGSRSTRRSPPRRPARRG